MNMLAQTLGDLGDSLVAWGLVAALFSLALWSVWRFRRCPQLRGEFSDRTRAAAEAYLARRIAEGRGYFLIMSCAIVATVAGLVLIAGDRHSEAGFFMVVAGVTLLQTEPLRQRIRIAAARVAAASPDDTDRRAAAEENLRDCHLSLVIRNFLLASAIGLGLLAF